MGEERQQKEEGEAGRAGEESQTVERSVTLSELVKVLVEEIMSHEL